MLNWLDRGGRQASRQAAARPPTLSAAQGVSGEARGGGGAALRESIQSRCERADNPVLTLVTPSSSLCRLRRLKLIGDWPRRRLFRPVLTVDESAETRRGGWTSDHCVLHWNDVCGDRRSDTHRSRAAELERRRTMKCTTSHLVGELTTILYYHPHPPSDCRASDSAFNVNAVWLNKWRYYYYYYYYCYLKCGTKTDNDITKCSSVGSSTVFPVTMPSWLWVKSLTHHPTRPGANRWPGGSVQLWYIANSAPLWFPRAAGRFYSTRLTKNVMHCSNS